MSLKYLSAPTKTLATSLNSSGMVLRVSDIKGWNGLDLTASDFGTIAYIVLRNATNTAIEIIEIDATTIASGNITINKRGLRFDGNLTTEVAANKLAWVQGSTLVDMGVNTPQMLQTLQENFEAAIIAGGVPATTSVLGLNRMSVAPVDPAVPIALGENDSRVLTADQKAATEGGGVLGTPDADNQFLTEEWSNENSENVQEFTANGTWTKPAGGKMVLVEVWGAGGVGGNGRRVADGSFNSGAGAGGAYNKKFFKKSDLTATVAVVVGAGGTASTPQGGNTTFGAFLTGFGGGPGFSANDDSHSSGSGGGLLGAGSGGKSTLDNPGGAPTVTNLTPSGTSFSYNPDDNAFGGGGSPRSGDGGCAVYGGAGASSNNSGNAGSSVYGGAAGGRGGSQSSTGLGGGNHGSFTPGGGTPGSAAGENGADGPSFGIGGAGGGGATAPSGNAGNGGNGGTAAGGGGGGSVDSRSSSGNAGNGGNGGNGFIRITVL